MTGEWAIFGLILAGGRSSRFGREKAVEPLNGRPLIDWVAGVLAPPVLKLAVSAGPASGAAAYAAERSLTCLPDPQEGALKGGPLAGVLQGLRWAASEPAAQGRAVWLATAPCDVPLLPAGLVEWLWARRSAGGAVARTRDGLQPLCALWPPAALDVLAALDRHPPIRQVIQALGAAEVEFADAKAFSNLNRPQDLTDVEGARYRPAAGGGPAPGGAS